MLRRSQGGCDCPICREINLGLLVALLRLIPVGARGGVVRQAMEKAND